MSKKGFLMAIGIKLAIIALLLIIVFTLFQNLLEILDRETENSSTRNFQNLKETINNVLSTPGDYASDTLPYFLHQQHLLVGFDTAPDTGYGTSYKAETSHLFKSAKNQPFHMPSYCEGKACICLYEQEGLKIMQSNTLETRDEKVIEPCIKFEEEITFIGSLSETEFPVALGAKRGQIRNDLPDYEANIPDEYKLPMEYLVAFGSAASISEIYVEKQVIDGKTYILITPGSIKTDIRKQFFKKCSEDIGDEKCRGKRIGYVFKSPEAEALGEENPDIFKVCKESDIPGKCYEAQLRKCGQGKIYETCICGSGDSQRAYTEGYCSSGRYTLIDCDAENIKGCKGYCTGGIGFAKGKICSEELDQQRCRQDPCFFNCRLTATSAGHYTCVERT